MGMAGSPTRGVPMEERGGTGMMIGWLKRRAGAAGVAAMVLALWLCPAASGAAVEWAGFAGNAQHTATARTPAQPFHRIRWRASVDLAPNLFGTALLIHYGSPMITAANTVLVPTRVSDKAGYRVVAYSGRSGARRWSLGTDYRPPAFTGGTSAPGRLRCPPR